MHVHVPLLELLHNQLYRYLLLPTCSQSSSYWYVPTR